MIAYRATFPQLQETLVHNLIQARHPDLLAPILVTGPSRRLLDEIQRQLARQSSGLLNLHFVTFFALAQEMQAASAHLQPSVLQDPLFYEVIIHQTLAEQGVSVSKGLPAALRNTLKDLMDADVDSESLLEAAAEGHFKDFDEQQMQIFHIYKSFRGALGALGVSTPADRLRATTEEAARSSYLKRFTQIHAIGFYDLTQVQLDFFLAVSKACPTTLYFPLVKDHPNYAFAQEFFETYLQGQTSMSLKTPSPLEGEGPPMNDSLVTWAGPVRGGRGQGGEESHPHLYPPPSRGRKERWLWSCSGSRDEIWACAKEILRLTEEEGIPFDRMGLVARSLGDYLEPVRAVFSENKIPWHTSALETASRHPLVKAVLAWVTLLTEDLPRRETMDLLLSPYWKAPEGAHPMQWDYLSRSLGIPGGWEVWQKGLSPWTETDFTSEENDRSPTAPISKEEVRRLLQSLETVRSHRLPETAPWSELATRLEEALQTHFGVARLEGVEAAVWEKILEAARGFQSYEALRKSLARDRFLSLFAEKLGSLKLELGPGNAGIPLLDAMAARGLSFDVLFLVGMNEDLFPRTIREDPFLHDRVRARLRSVLGNKVPLKLQGYQEEKLLFQLLLDSSPRVYALYQRTDEEGKPRLRSLLLEEAGFPQEPVVIPRRLSEKITPTLTLPPRGGGPAQEQPPIDLGRPRLRAEAPYGAQARKRWTGRGWGGEYLTPQEAALAMAWSGLDPEALLRATTSKIAVYRAQRKSLKASEARGRLGPHDGITGPLPEFWKALTLKGFSPTSLETYATCPYQYFAKKVLLLEPLEDPVVGRSWKWSERGQVYHHVLERFYRSLSHPELVEGDKPVDTLRQAQHDWATVLDHALEETFAETPVQSLALYPVLGLALKREIRENLTQFLAADLEEQKAAGLSPQLVEKDLTARVEGILFRGTPDRVDANPDGRFRVIDYKTKSPYDRKLETLASRGRVLQPLFYLLMAADALGSPVEKGESALAYITYADEPFQRLPGTFWSEHRPALLATLRALTRGIQKGEFFIRPDTHCRACAYTMLCRKEHLPTRHRRAVDPRTRTFDELGKTPASRFKVKPS